jgi:hypothetical protein
MGDICSTCKKSESIGLDYEDNYREKFLEYEDKR